MSDLNAIVEKLCTASIKDYVNPYDDGVLHWTPEASKDEWYTTPEFMSLYGTEAYSRLSPEQQRLLSFYEAVNFFSLNINGEKPLCEGITHRLYRKDTIDISRYLHHFLDEENKHMTWFGTFCTRYAGKVYPDKKVMFPKEYEPGEEDFLFFAKVMIFEELVDTFNMRMSLDKRLHPVARQINHLHHHDEARHLVFGRQLVAQLWERYADKWQPGTKKDVQNSLKEYVVATWKEYYNPQVYKDAGLDNAFDLQEQAYACEAQRQLRRSVSAGCVKYLLKHGMIEEEPAV